MKKTDPLFDKRTLVIVIALGLFGFLSYLVFGILAGDSGRARSAGANSFSSSAIGHKAFLELLRELEIPVVVSRNESAIRAWGGPLLMILEPTSGDVWGELRASLPLVDKALVVLPKRFGVPRADKTSWISSAELLSLEQTERVLRSLAPEASLIRGLDTVTWQGNDFGPPPDIPALQLMEGPGLRPLISSGSGTFFAKAHRDDLELFIISDPDILSNHGLRRGQNAGLLLSIVEELRDGEAIVLDETIHGFLKVPSLWRSLLEFPLVTVSLAALATILLLIWAAAGRFGPSETLPPPLKPGRGGLVENATRLLLNSGHEAEILQRYWRVQLKNVMHHLHAPPGLGDKEEREWLERLEKSRGLTEYSASLEQEVALMAAAGTRESSRLLMLARRFERWKKELLNGSRGGS